MQLPVHELIMTCTSHILLQPFNLLLNALKGFCDKGFCDEQACLTVYQVLTWPHWWSCYHFTVHIHSWGQSVQHVQASNLRIFKGTIVQALKVILRLVPDRVRVLGCSIIAQCALQALQELRPSQLAQACHKKSCHAQQREAEQQFQIKRVHHVYSYYLLRPCAVCCGADSKVRVSMQ